MAVTSPAFKETYAYYLAQIANIDMAPRAAILGIRVEKDEAVIPFLGRSYRVSSRGIKDSAGEQPFLGIGVILSKYILLCPDRPSLDKEWVSYKDFKDAAPLSGSFATNTEHAIAEHFAGRLDDLASACKRLGGLDPGLDLPYQLEMKLYPLPKVAVLILFDDADDEFPSQCKVLFERRAEQYLDPECMAILGMVLFDSLKKAAE